MKRCMLFVISLILSLCTMNNVAMAAIANAQNILFIGDSVTLDAVHDSPIHNFVYTIVNNGYSARKFAFNPLTSSMFAKAITNTWSDDDTDYSIEAAQISSNDATEAINWANYVLITTGGDDIRIAEQEVLDEIYNLLDISPDYLIEGSLDSDVLAGLDKYFKNVQNNDLIQNVIENFKTNLNTIIQAINSKNPNAKIIIQTIYNPYLGLPSEHDLSKILVRLFNTFADPMNAYIASIAATNKSVIVAGVANEFVANSNTSLTKVSDMGIPQIGEGQQTNINSFYETIFSAHQNAAGDALIAKVLLNIFQQPTIVTNESSPKDNSVVNTLPKTGQNYTTLHILMVSVLLLSGTTAILIKKRKKLIFKQF